MKKIVLLFTLGLSLSLALAQKPSLNKAYNAYSNQDYIEAKQLIDECVADPKLATKATTYLYKGNIYLYLSNSEYQAKKEDPNYVIKYPDAPVIAFDAFKKALELDKNVEGYQMLNPDQALPTLYGMLFVYGVDVLIANRYKEAIGIFQKATESYEMGTPSYSLNGELYYFYGYALEMDQNPDAKLMYEKAIKDSSQNINVYIRLIEQYKKEAQMDKVSTILKQAKQFFPQDPSIRIAEIDYLFYIKDSLTARKMLDNLPNSIYQNADLLFNVSNCYIQDGNYLKANELLKIANNLTPNSYNIIYNLGVCNYYISNEKFKISNELEVKGDKINADKIKIEYKYHLNEAQIYFEKVLEMSPEDLNVLNTLMSIYGRTQSPKFEEISKKIEQLKKQ